MATCTICDTRKGKRYCTARGEDICTQCCATEREVTINCPYSCSYLRESRLHEKRPLDEAGMPHIFTYDSTFSGPENLKHVYLEGGAWANETIDSSWPPPRPTWEQTLRRMA